ncbi:hypothetical protein D3C81_2230040 [compost metagenome]
MMRNAPVGASLLAMECQSTPLCLNHHREQARSYSSGRRIVRVFRGLSYHELFNFP